MSARVVTRIEERGPRGRLAFLTIAREEKLNALDPETIAALTAAARALHGDAALRAVVLTGAGERAFIGGADIATMSGLDPDGAHAFITSLHEAIAAVRAIPVPVIARVNGYCLGAGLEVAAGCDPRGAPRPAMVGLAAGEGRQPSVIEAARLPRLIGVGRSAELVLLGENIDAARALAIGLVEKVVPPDQLDAAVDAWLEAILAAGPQAVRIQKALMREWERLPLDEAIKAGITSFRTSVAGGEPARMLAEFTARRRK